MGVQDAERSGGGVPNLRAAISPRIHDVNSKYTAAFVGKRSMRRYHSLEIERLDEPVCG